MKWAIVLLAVLALAGAVLLERRRAAGPVEAEDPGERFRGLHDAALASLVAPPPPARPATPGAPATPAPPAAPDPRPFEAALAAAADEGLPLDRDLYARAIGWLREGRRDLAIAGFRESAWRALGAPDDAAGAAAR